MRCIHIYRGTPQLGGIKLHTHFPWFHTAKWGVCRIAPRTVLHVKRIFLALFYGSCGTVELHGSECLPDSPVCVRINTSWPPRLTWLTNAQHTHTHTHTHILVVCPCGNSHIFCRLNGDVCVKWFTHENLILIR